ncbi:MAG: creatininase family protein, partial [Bacteroidales bacterium]|nr:creatininase family protein [Candidatus Cacconaster scatequi]
MMHYYPELVRMEYAGDGASRKFAVDGLNRKVAWIPRNWSKVTDCTGIGAHPKSSAEKGNANAAAVVAGYVRLVVDLCRKELY